MDDKRRHIVFISSWYPTKNKPFNGDFVQRHAKAVSLLNDVTVIHAEGLNGIGEAFTTHRKQSAAFQEYLHYFPKSKFRIVNLVRKTLAYFQLAKQLRPYQIVHANVFYFSILWAFLQKIFGGKRIVLTEHWTASFDHYKRPFLKTYWKLFTPLVNYFLPVSENLAMHMQNAGLSGNYEVVPNVISTDIFKVKAKETNELIRFLHVSSLNFEQKNITGILEAIKKVANRTSQFHFELGGTGTKDELNEIQEFIRENQLNSQVTLFNELEHYEVAEKMQQADCFVLFSNFETQAIVKFESFSVGTPVICSDLDVLLENFPDSFGLTVEMGNTDDLANAMLSVINGQEFATPEVMHQFVHQNFNEKVIAEQFNEVYNKISPVKQSS